jgi:tetratricopeptide (TPR) repeat protein
MKQLLTPLLMLLALAAATPCWGQDPTRQFITALEAYKSGDYAAAISGLESIADSGVRNGELFYNIGNAHLKNNDLGRAILWYERARRLIPNDPDLNFNLTYARSLTRDAPEEGQASLVRIFFFWKYQLSAPTILILALAGNLLFWCLAMGWRFTRRRGLRRAMLIVLVPTVVFIFTAGFNYYEGAHRRQGIVLTEQAPVRSGLEATSTELFILHAGAKVKVVKTLKAHFQIQFSDDKIGWVEQSQVGLI